MTSHENPTSTSSSKNILKVCNMQELSLATCFKVLQEIATIKKSKTKPPLYQRRKSKRLKWMRKYKRMDFPYVIFINKCHATVDGPDEWAKCWISLTIVLQAQHCPVMFWPPVNDGGSIRPFQIENVVKIG